MNVIIENKQTIRFVQQNIKVLFSPLPKQVITYNIPIPPISHQSTQIILAFY